MLNILYFLQVKTENINMALTEHGNSSANVSLKDSSVYEQYTNSSEHPLDYWYELYYDEYKQGDSTHKPSFIDVLSIVLSILGIIANILSIYFVKRIYKTLSSHLKLIISLCVSDCLIPLPCLLKHIYIMTRPLNVCFNVAVKLITDMALLASLLNLLAIAVDHYLAILKPLMHKRSITNSRAICAVLVIWAVSVLAISVEVIMGMIHKKEMEPLCNAIAYDKINSELGIVCFIFVVLVVILVIYCRIYICVIRNRATHSRTRHRKKDSSNKKTLVTTSLFVLTFVLFWTPVGIFNMYMYNVDENYIIEHMEDIIHIGEILYVILLLNAIADPIIYTFRLLQIHRRGFTFNNKIRRQSTKMIMLSSNA